MNLPPTELLLRILLTKQLCIKPNGHMVTTVTVTVFALLFGLFWVVAFDVSLDQRGMREGTFGVVHIGVGVVVKQHNGLVLRDDADGGDQLLQLIVEHPLVARQVDLLAGFDVFQ